MSLDAQQTAGVALPESPARPVVETLHGVEIVDPYRWLEDGDSEEVRAWTEAQNAYTRRLLDNRPERPVIRERLAQLLHTGFVEAPVLKADRYFYTTRYPGPGTVPPEEERYHRNVFLHHLGADPGRDPLIYADPDPQAIPELYLSIDGRYLLIQSYHGWSKVTLLWRDLHAPGPEFTDVSAGLEAIFTCEEAQGSLYVHTNWDAPKFRVFKAPLAAPLRSNWQEIIPEGPHALQTLTVAGSWLVGQTLENALSHLRLVDLAGRPRGEIELPAAGTVYGPASSHDKDEVLFAFTSFAYPLSAYRYQPRESRLELFRAPRTPVGVDPDRVAVRQVWYASKDGTPIS